MNIDRGRLTYYAAKKFNITRRTIYRWIEEGVKLSEIEKRMREVGSEELITPEDAANMFNVSKQTIYHWLKIGKINNFQLFFRVVRFSKKELLKIKSKGI